MNQIIKAALFAVLIINEITGSTYYKKPKTSGIWSICGTLHLLCRDGTSLTTRIKSGESIKATTNKFKKQKPDALVKPYQMKIKND